MGKTVGVVFPIGWVVEVRSIAAGVSVLVVAHATGGQRASDSAHAGDRGRIRPRTALLAEPNAMRQWLGRWRRWVMATRARRSALTLAVLAAMAAPFATGSYRAKPYSFRDVPLTAEDRRAIIARWGEDSDPVGCKQAAKPPSESQTAKPSLESLLYQSRWDTCIGDRWALKLGHRREDYLSLSQYVALNGAVMLAVLTVTFFVLTAAMAAVSKWWRWWW